jgi:hypothetical protein
MDRIAISPDPLREAVTCWHCGRAVAGRRVARYLYRGERPTSALLEDWHRCSCGAYQNVRRTSEITVKSIERR